MNVIIIKGLRIDAAVGVTAAERKNLQRLEVNAVITPLRTFTAVADEIDRTVDYHAAAQRGGGAQICCSKYGLRRGTLCVRSDRQRALACECLLYLRQATTVDSPEISVN
jgi:hypothetical protein